MKPKLSLLFLLPALLLCSCDQKDANKQILENWRLISVAPDKDEPPLCAAIRQNASMEVIKAFLDLGAGVNPGMDYKGMSPLSLAARKGDMELVKFLYEKGASVNLTTKEGWSYPLLAASENGDPELVKFLLDKGADVNLFEREQGPSPLQAAIRTKKPELVKILIDAGSDLRFPFQKSAYSYRNGSQEYVRDTPLLLAVSYNCPEIVEMLLDAGGEELLKDYMRDNGSSNRQSNRSDESYNAFARAVVGSSNTEMVDVFLKKGISVDTPCNKEGETGLMIATQMCDSEKVEYLLKKGADKDKKSKDGKTALDMAEKKIKELTDRIENAQGTSISMDGVERNNKDYYRELYGETIQTYEKIRDLLKATK